MNLPIYKKIDSNTKVLVADDNIINQKFISKYFDSLKINYVLANNGLEVLDILSKEKIDIIYMDCQMPEMDGLKPLELSEKNMVMRLELLQ